ncbi:DMT family transporter [Derxia gummosa]|uniref:DMT family transporter n=1 Tax=Derxia gummosa DSM 723 TaxID=1121388 RepID=A0A8B6X3F5_9BURK|nr:DMT family transporter [Derxia gummosa]
MNTASLLRLLCLSAIWGASFPLMRHGVPALGAGWMSFCRIGLGALFLCAVAWRLGRALDWRAHWRHYLFLGLFNTALPFVLIGVAARTLPSSMLAILNATAPTWATLIGAAMAGGGLAPTRLAGLGCGVLGVTLIAGVESLHLPAGAPLAIAASLGAALSYGVSSVYAKSARAVEPVANASGSLWAATAFALLMALSAPLPAALPGPTVLAGVLALGVLCSGLAYLLYFRLVADVGAASALTVTFLVPVFGMLWGVVFLGERIGWHTVAGSGLVLVGTGLVTGFRLPWPARAERGN